MPVYVVLESLPTHQSKAVAAICTVEEKLQAHFLPTYAPDTSPEAFV